jgi:hypothetical protein
MQVFLLAVATASRARDGLIVPSQFNVLHANAGSWIGRLFLSVNSNR